MTSIIHEDIRKRSIRLQRDQILSQMRQEEEYGFTSIPRRLIMEVEERARESVDSNSWKRYAVLLIITGAIIYGLYKIVKLANASYKSSFSIESLFPISHGGFIKNTGPDWLMSDISGKLTFSYFNPDTREAVDYITSEDNKFPSSRYSTEEDFQTAIYNRAQKKELCETNEVTYLVVLDNSSISYECRFQEISQKL